MLLSRFAESLYWAGRYLERAEATARLVRVHTELFLDLPRAAGVGWSPLLAVTGAGDEFLGRHTGPDEDDVVAFLAIDPKNRGSILASIGQATVSLQLSRVLLPTASFEVVTKLQDWAAASSAEAIDRRTRLDWMDEVIARCQLLAGSLAGTMCDDEAYGFLQIGRYLERADMTIRVLDVQAGILVGQPGEDAGGEPYHDLTWMGVLRSLAAHQMFRRSQGSGVPGPAAVRFLLREERFPRSVEFCLASTARALTQLPRAAVPLAGCARVRSRLRDLQPAEVDTPGELHELADDLESGIGALHDELTRTYFRLEAAPPAVVAPA
ncbi:MAG TPA: alpha-E domain-containing protein [Pseudonocardia sp.]|jgi:uncharacterized alpha-E superfamily protein|uniref:alpha-E domain-containing protein n=1 Tax=Pseudonocardia sp. TaxID=60912 RepID=UPI002EDAB292